MRDGEDTEVVRGYVQIAIPPEDHDRFILGEARAGADGNHIVAVNEAATNSREAVLGQYPVIKDILAFLGRRDITAVAFDSDPPEAGDYIEVEATPAVVETTTVRGESESEVHLYDATATLEVSPNA